MKTIVQNVMMMTLMTCCASFTTITAYAQSPAPASKCYALSIQGMTCEQCAVHLQKALAKVPGVAEAKVIYAKAEASVCTRPGANVTGETLVKVVEKAGYKAKVK